MDIVPFSCSAVAASDLALVKMAPVEQMRAADWAFDPATRHVFACDPFLNRVFVFDPKTGKRIKDIDTGAGPTAMILAERRLLVAHRGGLSIIDLDRLAFLREINNVGSPMALAYSAPDKLLYLSSEVSDGRNREQLLQVRINDWFVRGRVPWWQLKTRQVRRLSTSLEGNWLFAAVENRNAPGPYYLFHLANAELPTVPSEPAMGPQGEISAGPNSQLWFIGSALYSNDDFSRPVRKYAGDLTIVHPTADVAISAANLDASNNYDAKLWFQRYSTGNAISSHELSIKPSTGKVQARPYPLQRLALDDTGEFLLVADDIGAGVLSIPQQLLDDAGPALRLDLPSALRGVPNKPWTLKLPVPKNDPLRQIRVQIKQGPPGLKLVDDSLVWQPTMSDIGDHPVEIETKIGDRAVETRFTASIQIPHTSLGIATQRLVVNENGEFAAVFGQLSMNQAGRSTGPPNGPPSHVAIIRLNDLAVLRREAVTGDVRDPILDGENLYWLAKNVNVLHRLEVKGSRPIEDLPLHSSVAQMFPLGNDKLVLALADADQLTFRVLDRRSLKPVSGDFLSRVSLSPWSRRADDVVVSPVDDDLLYFQGQLLDQSSGDRRCFVAVPFGVPSLVPQRVSNPGWNLRSQSTFAWRRIINGNGVSQSDGQPLFQWRALTWAASRSIPRASAHSR